jgi:HAD superfamily hydrolase (TIGR01509 family)
VTVVLFDLGNVLVEVVGFRKIAEWLGESDHDAVVEHWIASPIVKRFERGQCAPDEFAAAIVAEYGLTISPTAFLDDFAHWPQGLAPGAAELVTEVRGKARTACFSNSNVIHWYSQRDHAAIKALFDVAFSSHEIGQVKPDRAAFEHVVRELRVDPGEIVFLDDSESNTRSARSLGIDAHRVRGVAEARASLAALGLAAP